MKRLHVWVIVTLMIFTLSASVSRASFDSQLSLLRGGMIGMCQQLQAGKPAESHQQLLGEVDEIRAQWHKISERYQDNPPQAYASDPAWRSYLTQVAENLDVVRNFVAGKQYNTAVRFCGMNCALFVKMQEVNGIDTLTNRMFHLRGQLKLTLAMARAGNWQGAMATLPKIEAMRKAIVAFPAAESDQQQAMVKQLDDALDRFMETVTQEHTQAVGKAFKQVLSTFMPLYLKSISSARPASGHTG